MTMRLQEVHPALVHYPLALLPTSVLADVLGRLTGSDRLHELGRYTMPLAAASGLVAGVFGFIAQESVEADGEAHDLLVTHRTLNLAAVALSALMVKERLRTKRPSWTYLFGGLAGLSVVGYSAYIGGKMVYTHGVGVEAAAGVREAAAPEVAFGTAAEVVRQSVRHVASGVRHALRDAMQGELIPALRPSERNGASRSEAPAPRAGSPRTSDPPAR
ncbi:MAG: DUF2231 domain-containing protein [Gemmatimonadota bacterium]